MINRRRLMMLSGQEEDKVKPYRLINTVILEEASNDITIDTDSDGNAFELDDIIVSVVGTCDQETESQALVVINNMLFPNAFGIAKTGTDTTNYGAILYNNGIVIVSDYAQGSFRAISNGNKSKTYVKDFLTEKVRKVTVKMSSAKYNIEAGTIFTLYGR